MDDAWEYDDLTVEFLGDGNYGVTEGDRAWAVSNENGDFDIMPDCDRHLNPYSHLGLRIIEACLKSREGDHFADADRKRKAWNNGALYVNDSDDDWLSIGEAAIGALERLAHRTVQ